DDVLGRLLASLLDERTGAAACDMLRRRFSHVLVDEFQDTDPVQWSILEQAFAHEQSMLTLVADPKQAIYSFRGADVYAYLGAAPRADTSATLPVNWRSDGDLLSGFDAFFGNALLGHPEISYRATRPAPSGVDRRIDGAPNATPLRIRLLRRDRGLVRLT